MLAEIEAGTATLADLLLLAEISSAHVDLSGSEAACEKVLSAAEEARDLGLLHRARVLRADLDRRRGIYGPAAQAVREALLWAEGTGDDLVTARCHRVWASLLRTLGDLNGGLEEAVLAVRLFPEGGPAVLRDYHVVGLATLLDESGSNGEAMRLLEELLESAIHRLDWELAVIVLNNIAYSHYERGQVEEASRHTDQILEIAALHQIPLDGMELDTVARVQLLRGDPGAAVSTLLPLVDQGGTSHLNERSSWADCMLTYVEALRVLGRVDEAQQVLDQVRDFCDSMGLAGQRVQVHLAQAELLAGSGRWQEAYEEHRVFHTESEALRSARREQRAHLMEAILQLEQARRETSHYRRLATEDELTGLPNRRRMNRELERLCIEASRRAPLSIALVDVDHFKRINDEHSHGVGDLVLVEVARLLENARPTGSIVGRLGGDEFTVLLPRTDADQAAAVAEDLRRIVAEHSWDSLGGPDGVSLTIGTATSTGALGRSELLALADQRLYAGKRMGRNRVVGEPEED
jgi:diguanylate cyclase (GGDEF)-like protein